MSQFSLKTLMIAVSICALGCGIFVWGYQRGYMDGYDQNYTEMNGVRVEFVPITGTR